MKSAPVSGRWQRFLRNSVGGLIVLVLVIGAGLGWLVRSARIQHEAFAAIEYAGGSVAYNWKFDNGLINRNSNPWAPRWLVDYLGVDYFGHVTAVRLVTLSTRIDESIVQVGPLPRWQRIDLHLQRTSINEADLSQ
jgi:hypothetical protein